MSPVQRTIAMPVWLAGSIFIAVFFSACSDKIKTDINVFKALDESLVNSNSVIDRQSQTVLATMEQKLYEPITADKAKRWHPKAQLIQKLSKDIYIYIEELKSDLKKEAGLKTDKGIESFRESDKNAVIRLFDKKGKGGELYEQLRNYKQNIMSIDTDIRLEFDKSFLLTTKAFDASSKQQEFNKVFFDDIPTMAALALLSKFENNIKVMENRTITFCTYRIPEPDHWYDYYQSIVVQSSSYVRIGEVVEITAGVGAFSKAALPRVSINGKEVSLDEDGAAHYKFKAPDETGKHVVRVRITFIDQEGKQQTILKELEFTVAR